MSKYENISETLRRASGSHEVSGESRTTTVILPRATVILATSGRCRHPSFSQALQRNRAQLDFWEVKITVGLWENHSPTSTTTERLTRAHHGWLRGYGLLTRDTPTIQTTSSVPHPTMVARPVLFLFLSPLYTAATTLKSPFAPLSPSTETLVFESLDCCFISPIT